jgi:hypothetical protein
MSFVLDSSVALSWCFEDEHTPTGFLQQLPISLDAQTSTWSASAGLAERFRVTV